MLKTGHPPEGSEDNQAGELRNAINPIMLGLPLHLSLITFEEANSIDVSSIQNSSEIITLDSIGTDKEDKNGKEQ